MAFVLMTSYYIKLHRYCADRYTYGLPLKGKKRLNLLDAGEVGLREVGGGEGGSRWGRGERRREAG